MANDLTHPKGPQDPAKARFVLIGTKGVYLGGNAWSGDVKDSTAEYYPTFDLNMAKEHLKRMRNEGRLRGEDFSAAKFPAVPDRQFSLSLEAFEKQKLNEQLLHQTTDGVTGDSEDAEGVEHIGAKEPKKVKPKSRKKKHEEETE